MANEQNLVPQAHVLTVEEQSEGGRKSGEARRKKKELRECFEALLEQDIKTKDGKVLTGAEAIALKVFEQALKGDKKAFEIVRDTAGQKPASDVVISGELNKNNPYDELSVEDLKALAKKCKANEAKRSDKKS